MKTLFLLPILLLSLISCSSETESVVELSSVKQNTSTVSSDDLVVRSRLYYKKFSEIPFTGEVTGEQQGRMENGKKKGAWVYYHKNGQLWMTGSYSVGGYREGEWHEYLEDGRWNAREVYGNGSPTLHDFSSGYFPYFGPTKLTP